jgi:uncharacterized protein (TIGR03435 family)
MRLTLAVLALSGAVVTGQDAPLRWEAVSIKPVNRLPVGPGARGADLLNLPYATLQQLVVLAYRTPTYRVVGGPAWVSTARFAVLAKTDAPASIVSMRPLLQQLLADRFALMFHRESREIAAYDLVVARRDRRLGDRITPAPVDCMPFLTGQRPQSEAPTLDYGTRTISRCGNAMSTNLRTGLDTPLLKGITMDWFASYLEGPAQRPVRNRTDLSGVFDIELTYLDERTMQLPGRERATPPEGSSLTTAVSDQLGLKLESTRVPVDMLVIDSASMPAPD